MERLVFGYGTGGHNGETPSSGGDQDFRLTADATGRGTGAAETPVASALSRKHAAGRESRDWAFLGLMAFTAVLFFRPQDLVTPLRALHLAEVTAVVALGALIASRLGRGLTLTRLTPELVGVLAFAGIMLATAPFSVWMGGAVATFTGQYAKVVLIFVLMVNTLTSPRRIEQFTWLIVIASGYIAGLTVIDYARGVNLVEYGRVQGAVGGMFKNPNDLALNMVSVLPLVAFLLFRPLSMTRRAAVALCGVLMLGAIVASQSRSGTVGLAAMMLVLGVQMLKRNPGVVFAAALAGVLALPLLPSSYWQRMASIADKDLDQTGSREARSILLKESFDAFVARPLTGVGAGQFVNYNPEGRQEAWRESHNSVLQVASELGIGGLVIFSFLLARAAYAPIQTRRLLRAMDPDRRPSRKGAPLPVIDPYEAERLRTHAGTLAAALAGWFVCALFASVAYHWTFYYLLALATAPREYLLTRVADARQRQRAVAGRTVVAAGVHP